MQASVHISLASGVQEGPPPREPTQRMLTVGAGGWRADGAGSATGTAGGPRPKGWVAHFALSKAFLCSFPLRCWSKGIRPLTGLFPWQTLHWKEYRVLLTASTWPPSLASLTSSGRRCRRAGLGWPRLTTSQARAFRWLSCWTCEARSRRSPFAHVRQRKERNPPPAARVSSSTPACRLALMSWGGEGEGGGGQKLKRLGHSSCGAGVTLASF